MEKTKEVLTILECLQEIDNRLTRLEESKELDVIHLLKVHASKRKGERK
ncbi:hypothetical protein [Alteribacillus iranensis]|nr:hypothetical protein [Alteribacillus iranensis]